ncbi:MAG: Polyprenyl synthetase [Promethearchaeota archaeon CR_4]|nr:MAG: Polyprenyl synthetase [Candidatus Lokiarchaeota archaeon CR_4]
MDFQSILVHEKAQFDKELRAIFDSKVQESKNPILKNYYQMLGEYISPNGGEAKRLRPLLVHQAFEAFRNPTQKPIPQGVIYRLACCVELLHNASLIHDDIIDNDAFRRGQPAFHTRYMDQYLKNANITAKNPPEKRAADFGRNMGILGGDHAYFIGLESIIKLPLNSETRVKLVELYHQAFDGIVEGVIIEENLANIPEISLEDYMFMIQMKTAHLLLKSAAMGLLLAGVSPVIEQKMLEFITKLGQAFQIQDDILGTFGDSVHKPTDSDIIEGKKTVLLTHALTTMTPAQLKVIQEVMGNPQARPGEVERVREIFRSTGALAKSQGLLKTLTIAARETLKEILPNMTPGGRDFFGNLIDFIIQRTY